MAQYVIRSNDGSGYHVKSFGMTVSGGYVNLTFDPYQALLFGSWDEAAAAVSFIVFHIDEDYCGEFEIAESVL